MVAEQGSGRRQNVVETRNSMGRPYRQDLGADPRRPEKIRTKPRVKPMLLSVHRDTRAVAPRAHDTFNEKFP